MKKKILNLFVALCVLISGAILGTYNMPKNEAIAYTANSSTYKISNTESTFKVEKGTENTEFASNLDSLNSAFSAILADESLSADSAVEIYFSSLTLSANEQITLSRNFVLSGSLTINNSTSLFVLENPSQTETQTLFCDNLTLLNNSTTLENFAFFEVNNSNTNITLLSTHFNLSSSQSSISHAIKFNSMSHNLLLKGEISHDTTYFYNYMPNVIFNLDQDNENADDFYADSDGTAVPTDEKLIISVPYFANNSTLSGEIETVYLNIFQIVADGNFFNVNCYNINNKFSVSTNLTFAFDENAGTYAQDYTPPSTFYFNDSANNYTFPTSENLSRTNYHLIGWFGKITYNSTTYYFDQECLSDYLENNTNANAIETYFKTNLNDFSAENSFTGYSYSSRNTENALAKYSAVEFMAEMGQAPTFVAKWEIDSYTVSFVTNSNTVIQDKTYDFGATLTRPTDPTKLGYTFDKWFKNESLTIPFDFDSETMPANNLTLYAGYTINTYTISFVTNTTETTISPINYTYGAEIASFETPTKLGYTFAGWFLEDSFTNKFDYTNMPAEHLTLYACWITLKLKVYFNSMGGTMFADQWIDYNTYVSKPTNPTKLGYTFDGWYYDYNCSSNKLVTFNQEDKILITQNITFYAKWTANLYNLLCHTNINNETINNTYTYNQQLTLPTGLNKANYIFDGWFSDEALTERFTLETMPARSVNIYAKWKAKRAVVFDESAQTYISDALNPSFSIDSVLNNFLIKYKVGNDWVLEPPTDIGTYDILITRNEDETYANYEKVLSGAFIIEPVEKNYKWLIAIFFAVFILEIIVSVVVRVLRKMKQNMVITSLAIITGNAIIPSNQVVLLAISGVCMVAGFVVMCYQLVQLHRTVPLALLELEDKESSMEKHFKHSEKIISNETPTYSANDIEDMLKHDSVGYSIREKHNLDSLEKTEEKEKSPIGPIAYHDDDNDSVRKVEDDEFEDNIENELIRGTENASESSINNTNVEIVEDEFVANAYDENERLYNSDDPFLRKDPNDYLTNKDDE